MTITETYDAIILSCVSTDKECWVHMESILSVPVIEGLLLHAEHSLSSVDYRPCPRAFIAGQATEADVVAKANELEPIYRLLVAHLSLLVNERTLRK